MPPTTTAAESARMHRVFCDATRVAACRTLAERGEARVSELCAILGAEQTALSHSLALLRSAGVVETRRDGRSIYYRLADGARERLGAALLYPLTAAV